MGQGATTGSCAVAGKPSKQRYKIRVQVTLIARPLGTRRAGAHRVWPPARGRWESHVASTVHACVGGVPLLWRGGVVGQT